MLTVNLSLFEEFSRRGSQGYNDDTLSLSVLGSVSSSILESLERDKGSVDNMANVDKNKAARIRVAILFFGSVEIYATNEGVEPVQTLPVFTSYD